MQFFWLAVYQITIFVYHNNIQKIYVFFWTLLFHPLLNDSGKTGNCSKKGLGFFCENLFIGIRNGFSCCFSLIFPVFCGEYHRKYGWFIINDSCNYRGDLCNFMLFYHKQNKNMMWKFRQSQFSIDFPLKTIN